MCLYKKWYFYIRKGQYFFCYFILSFLLSCISIYYNKLVFIYKLSTINNLELSHFIVTDIYEFFFSLVAVLSAYSFLVNVIYFVQLSIIEFHGFSTKAQFKRNFTIAVVTMVNFTLTYVLVTKILIPFTYSFFLNLTSSNPYFLLNYELRIANFLKNLSYFFFAVFLSFQIPMCSLCFLEQQKMTTFLRKRKTFYLSILLMFSLFLNGDFLLQGIIYCFLFIVLEAFFFLVIFLNSLNDLSSRR